MSLFPYAAARRALTAAEMTLMRAFPAPGVGPGTRTIYTAAPSVYLQGVYDRATGRESWEVRSRFHDTWFAVFPDAASAAQFAETRQ